MTRTGTTWQGLVVRSLAGAAAGLFVLAVVALGLMLAISRGWQRERIVEEVEVILSEALGAPVELQALDGPLVPELTARGLRVGGIEIGALKVRWQLEALLRERRLAIDEAAIEGVRARVERDAEGRWVLPLVLPASEAPEEPGLAWRIERMHVVDAQLRLDWTLEDAPGFLVMHLDGELEGIEVAEDGLPGADFAGWLGGRLAGEIDGSPVEEGDLRLELPGARGLRVTLGARADIGHVALDARAALPARVDWGDRLLQQTSWQLAGVSLSGEAVEVAGSGAGVGAELDRLALDLSLERLERLAALLGLEGDGMAPALAGRLQARAELSGPAGRPSGAVSVHGQDLVYDGHRLGALDARFRVQEARTFVVDALTLEGGSIEVAAAPGARFSLEDGRLEIAGLSVRSGDRSADIAGGLDRDGARGLTLSAREIEVDPLSVLAGAPSGPGGVADLTLRLDGPWSAPRGEAVLAWRGLARPDIAAFDAPRVRMTLRSDGRRIELSGRADVATREGVATWTGTFPFPSDLVRPEAWLAAPGARAVLSADAVELAWLAPWLPEGFATPAGRARLELSLAGGAPRPHLSGWLELEGGIVEARALASALPIEGRVRLEDDDLRVEQIRLGPEDARATLSGWIRIEDFAPGDVDLSVDLDGFRLELANGEGDAGPDPDFDSGRIDGRVRLTGRLAAPVVQAQIEWRRPRWQSFTLDRVTLDAVQEGARVVGSAKVEYEGAEIATLSASLPIPADPTRPRDWLAEREAVVRMHGERLELAMLAPWLPRGLSQPSGLADFDLALRGGEPLPGLSGRFALDAGSLNVRPLRRILDNVTARASIDNEIIQVESLSIGTPGARAEVRGTIALRELRPTDLDLVLSLERFPLSRSPLARTDVDGELTLAGTAAIPDLRGRLSLVDATFRVRSADDPAVKEIRFLSNGSTAGGTSELVENGSAVPDLFDRASVDVSLEVPRTTWVRGPGLDLNLYGSARAQKLADEPPRLSGELETLRGTFKLHGRRFEVRRGRLGLDGGSEIDPVIDIEAVHRVARVDVIAYLTGRVSAPELRLASEPPMSESDIVSYLIFGRPANQLASSEQSGVNMAAAALAAGIALEELREIFGDAMPIDTADVLYNGDDGTTYVEVGKYVARDIFVRYGQTFGPEPVEEVGVSWRLNDNWILESSTSSNASAGGDIFWVLEY